ncbi:MAG: hypothetical protein HY673_17545 [Chloroflexi bacterium]|nr:hypothetical protein [Chloroflexota bacterium]
MERMGVPSVALVTTAMESLGRSVIKGDGFPNYPMIVLDHPVAEMTEQVVRSRITPAAVGQIIRGLTVQPEEPPDPTAEKADEMMVYQGDDPIAAMRAMNDDFLGRGWGDGLPLVPPTTELVHEMLAATRRSPGQLLGLLGPRHGRVTVENLALNAVMAGARPEYMPVLLSMMEAALRPEFDLSRSCVTTNPVAPVVIVSGPVTDQLNMNARAGVFGPGFQANATIGRALRLVMITTGGAVPGEVNKSTQGQFARYTAAWAVNRADNPFPSLQEQMFSSTRLTQQVTEYYKRALLAPPKFQPIGRDENVVIMFNLLEQNNVNDNISEKGTGILTSVSTAMLTEETPRAETRHRAVSGPLLVVFGPQHARILAAEGWTISNMRQFLYQKARYETWRYTPGHIGFEADARGRADRNALEPLGKDGTVTMLEHPDDIFFSVAGGQGAHSAVLVGGYGAMVMRKITN